MAASTRCAIVHVRIRDENCGLHLFKPNKVTCETYDDAAERVRCQVGEQLWRFSLFVRDLRRLFKTAGMHLWFLLWVSWKMLGANFVGGAQVEVRLALLRPLSQLLQLHRSIKHCLSFFHFSIAWVALQNNATANYFPLQCLDFRSLAVRPETRTI